MNDLTDHYSLIKKDLVYALAWRNSGDLFGPITEGGYFPDIAKLVIDGMETGQDHSKEVWDLLIKSGRAFYEGEEDERERTDKATRTL